MYRFLILLTVAAAMGLQAWQVLFNNFAVEVARLEGQQVGIIQSVREIPGFLALLAVYVMLLVREHRLSAFSILCLGIGLALTGLLPSYAGLLFTTLLSSFGYHYYETTNQSLTLQYFDQATTPWVFGQQRSISAATNIAVGLAIFLLARLLGYRQIYLLIGALVTALALWGFRQNPTRPGMVPQRRRMILRRRYWLFYFLTFMAGARRQIIMAFAVFLLVKKFGFSLPQVTLLFVVNNAVNFVLSPAVGRAIVRFGERRVLSLEYAALVVIFLCYATVESRWLAAGLYVVDQLVFNFAMAIYTFFHKIADPADIAPSMAVGFTINHIAAVVLPALGGYLWMIDYRIPFFAGAALAAVTLGAVQLIGRNLAGCRRP
jgi:predicted MFS family arabinose efflux permease